MTVSEINFYSLLINLSLIIILLKKNYVQIALNIDPIDVVNHVASHK